MIIFSSQEIFSCGARNYVTGAVQLSFHPISEEKSPTGHVKHASPTLNSLKEVMLLNFNQTKYRYGRLETRMLLAVSLSSVLCVIVLKIEALPYLVS